MEEKSLKNQAQEIMAAVDRDLQAVESKALTTQKQVDSKVNTLMDGLFGVINNVDMEAAAKRVTELRQKYPDATPTELSQKLIADKCQKTGAIGAVTSGAGLIPGIGTAAAVTLGVAADIGATFKLQAELVLEIAAVYDYPLTESEKKRIVMIITGLSTGTNTLARRAGQAAAVKVSEKFAEKAVLKALPVVGVIASAGTNVLSTYIIGQRADAYFRLGPDAMGSWADSLRTITGLDERKLGEWIAGGGAALALGAGKVGEAGKAAGEAVAVGAGKVAETTASGAKIAGQAAQRGLKAYFRWVISFWTAVFRLLGKILGFVWAALTFIPRKIGGLFKKKETKADD